MIRSVHAILLVDSRYALQLRDNDPRISGPGLWGLFGGEIELGEAPADALVRELHEELELSIVDLRLFSVGDGLAEPSRAPRRRWVFEADVSGQWGSHVLHEGQAARLFAFPEVLELPMASHTREVLRSHGQMNHRGGQQPPRRIS